MSSTPDPRTVDHVDGVQRRDQPAPDLEPGRPVVLEPTPPGLWRVLLGSALAALAPLFGFLVGGMIGVADSGAALDPMFLSLFLGIVVGGVGVLVAIAGGVRLWRHYHPREVAAEEAGLPPEAVDLG